MSDQDALTVQKFEKGANEVYVALEHNFEELTKNYRDKKKEMSEKFEGKTFILDGNKVAEELITSDFITYFNETLKKLGSKRKVSEKTLKTVLGTFGKKVDEEVEKNPNVTIGQLYNPSSISSAFLESISLNSTSDLFDVVFGSESGYTSIPENKKKIDSLNMLNIEKKAGEVRKMPAVPLDLKIPSALFLEGYDSFGVNHKGENFYLKKDNNPFGCGPGVVRAEKDKVGAYLKFKFFRYILNSFPLVNDSDEDIIYSYHALANKQINVIEEKEQQKIELQQEEVPEKTIKKTEIKTKLNEGPSTENKKGDNKDPLESYSKLIQDFSKNESFSDLTPDAFERVIDYFENGNEFSNVKNGYFLLMYLEAKYEKIQDKGYDSILYVLHEELEKLKEKEELTRSNEEQNEANEKLNKSSEKLKSSDKTPKRRISSIDSFGYFDKFYDSKPKEEGYLFNKGGSGNSEDWIKIPPKGAIPDEVKEMLHQWNHTPKAIVEKGKVKKYVKSGKGLDQCVEQIENDFKNMYKTLVKSINGAFKFKKIKRSSDLEYDDAFADEVFEKISKVSFGGKTVWGNSDKANFKKVIGVLISEIDQYTFSGGKKTEFNQKRGNLIEGMGVYLTDTLIGKRIGLRYLKGVDSKVWNTNLNNFLSDPKIKEIKQMKKDGKAELKELTTYHKFSGEGYYQGEIEVKKGNKIKLKKRKFGGKEVIRLLASGYDLKVSNKKGEDANFIFHYNLKNRKAERKSNIKGSVDLKKEQSLGSGTNFVKLLNEYIKIEGYSCALGKDYGHIKEAFESGAAKYAKVIAPPLIGAGLGAIPALALVSTLGIGVAVSAAYKLLLRPLTNVYRKSDMHLMRTIEKAAK